MRKPSEVLQIAKDDPQYLSGDHHHHNWLCAILSDLRQDGIINRDEYNEAREVINLALQTINGGYSAIYLRGYLTVKRVIPAGTPYCTKTYHDAAHAFWADLITELQSQGL